MADQPLRGRKVAILLAPEGTEQAEFTEPRKAVTEAGADVDVIGAQAGSARTVNHDLEPGETFTVDKTFDQVSADALWVKKYDSAGLIESFDLAEISASTQLFSMARNFDFLHNSKGALAFPFSRARGRRWP